MYGPLWLFQSFPFEVAFMGYVRRNNQQLEKQFDEGTRWKNSIF